MKTPVVLLPEQSYRLTFFLIITAIIFFLPILTLSAQPVVPAGTTNTTVSVNGAGKTTVNIAPVVANGLSHNQYQSFNVPGAGVDLDNRSVGALTIINEVTSNQRSLIEGQLAVLGARAHVILANPNGITVNGGRFVNTAGLVLTTGKVDFIDRQIMPFLTQKNTLITTSGGDIEIGPDGLSGLFDSLVLAARQIKVNGPLINENGNSAATLKMIAGNSRMELDSSVVPGNLSKPWMQAQPYNSGSTSAILVDITRPASLSASNIQIAVTELGAGVRMAGSAYATAGDFYLAANGEVRLNGAQIKAENNIRMEARDATQPPPNIVAKGDDRRFELDANGHIELLSDSINMEHGTLTTDAGDVVLGRQGVDATSDFRFVGKEVGDGIVSGGGIGIYAQGKNAYLESLQIVAENRMEVFANDISLARGANPDGSGQAGENSVTTEGLYLEAKGKVKLTGSISTTADDLFVVTNHEVLLEGAQLSSADNLRIERLDPALAAPTLTAKEFGDLGFVISAANNVELYSNAIDLQHGQIAAANGNVILGNGGEVATGNFRFVGVDANDGISAGGALGIYARGQDAYLRQVKIQIAGGTEIIANNFTLDRGASGESSLASAGFYLQANGKVKLTGDLQTTTDDFYVATNHEVLVDGARIFSGNNLRVDKLDPALAAPVFTAQAGGGRGFLLNANGDVAVLSDAINLTRGQIIAQHGSVILGNKNQTATGNFSFKGVDANDGIFSAGGLGIYAKDKNVSLENLQVVAGGEAEIRSKDFSVNNPFVISVGGFDLQATGNITLTGKLASTAGDWNMAANGEVKALGVDWSSAGSIWLGKLNNTLAAPTLQLDEGNGHGFTVSAVGDIMLLTGANQLQHGRLVTQYGSVIIGDPGAAASGDFTFTGVGEGDGISAGNSVGLYAIGKNMRLDTVQISANDTAELFANDLTLNGRMQNGSWLPTVIQASHLNIWATGQVTVPGCDLLAAHDALLDSGALRLDAVQVNGAWRQSKILADDGDLTIFARKGGVTNEGSLLQGQNVSIVANGDVYNHTLDENTLGIIFASGENGAGLRIQSGANITNLTGRFISNSDLQLHANGKVYNGTAHTNAPGAGERVYYKRKSGWFFWRHTVSGWYIKLSDMTISGGQLAYILAGKGIRIEADELENDGGEIIANGGDIKIDVSRLINRAVASGAAAFERSSYWLWQRDKGYSTMQVHGGHINSAGDLIVNAAQSVANDGGQMLAISDLTISAPLISGKAIDFLSYYQRQDGMREIWLGEHIRIRSTPSGSDFISWGGNVNLLSPNATHIYGGGVNAAGTVNAPGGLDIVLPVEKRDNYGFLDFLF